jgi:hypothetical protein
MTPPPARLRAARRMRRSWRMRMAMRRAARARS